MKKTKNKIRFGLESIQELAFDRLWKEEQLEGLTKDTLQVKFFTQTRINLDSNQIKIKAGVSYLSRNEILFRLEILVLFPVEELGEIASVDTEGKQVHFNAEIVPIFLNTTVGALRGILFTKTQGTNLEQFPLPLMDTKMLIERNKFVLERP